MPPTGTVYTCAHNSCTFRFYYTDCILFYSNRLNLQISLNLNSFVTHNHVVLYLTTSTLVPPSHDDSSHQLFSVSVAHVTEQTGCRLDQRSFIQLDTEKKHKRKWTLHPGKPSGRSTRTCSAVPVEAQLVSDGIGDGLRVSRRPRATAVDPLVDGGQLISHAVGDVSAAKRKTQKSLTCPHINGSCLKNLNRWSLSPSGRAGVCTHDHSTFKLHSHDGGLKKKNTTSHSHQWH